MPVERSAGAVVFRKQNGKLLYLLLHYEEGHWGSSKGHIEKDETVEEAARREIQEETGITCLRFIEGFKELNKYYFHSEKGRVFKIVTFLLAETCTEDVRLSFEHVGYEWLPYEEALERITFKTEKEVLIKAHQFLLEHG